MSTYDEEKRILFQWLSEKEKEYDESIQNSPIVLDGKPDQIISEYRREFTQKFKELKEKYGIVGKESP